MFVSYKLIITQDEFYVEISGNAARKDGFHDTAAFEANFENKLGDTQYEIFSKSEKDLVLFIRFLRS